MADGELVCPDCGQTFILEDGMTITIDHFSRCPGGSGDG